MRGVHSRSLPVTTLIVMSVLVAGLLSMPAGSQAADPPTPTKKDSRLGIKSKNAELTTSVEPAEARPGETVTFKVTAKLEPGFHIYKYSKKEGPGPVNTTFDFFDPAGLKVDGDWTASQPPRSTRTPISPTSIPWSITKTRSPGASSSRSRPERRPGKRPPLPGPLHGLRREALQHPGPVDLPDAVLTVLPAMERVRRRRRLPSGQPRR